MRADVWWFSEVVTNYERMESIIDRIGVATPRY